MNFLKLFNEININNAYLIVNDKNKTKIIKHKSQIEIDCNDLFQFKIISESEFINLITFFVDDNIYLNLKNSEPISIIDELIKFSKYNLHNENLLLNQFIENNKRYFSTNNHFINNLKQYKFYHLGNPVLIKPFVDYYNLDYLNLINNSVFNSGNKILTHEFLLKKEEIFFLFESIANLLNKGIDINNIYICNIDESYYTELIKHSSFYNIPIDLNFNISLYDLPFVKNLFGNDLEEIISVLTNEDILKEQYLEQIKIDSSGFYNTINDIISVINKYEYNNDNRDLLKEVIINDLKNKKVEKMNRNNIINIINYDEICSLKEDDYLFILNAKYESFPKIHKNNDIITDEQKELINYPTSSDMNIKNNSYLHNLIKHPALQYISFSKHDKYNEYEHSDIFSELHQNKKVNSTALNDLTKGFAKQYYKSIFNETKQTGTYNQLLTTFTGDFNFTKDEIEVLVNHINIHDIKLTPSSITNYFRIPFIYYLERILKISTFEENVNLNIGNFFHTLIEVLIALLFEDVAKMGNEFVRDENLNQEIINYIIAKEVDDDFDYQLFFDEFFNLYFQKVLNFEDELDIKTIFFIKKNRDTIIKTITFVCLFIAKSNVESLLVEFNVETNNFTGKADLVIVNNDKKYSVIDFKTGNRGAYNKDKVIELLNDLLSNKDAVIINNLQLLQPLFYAYFLRNLKPDYSFNDAGFLSILSDKQAFNALFSSPKEGSDYTSSKAAVRILDENELSELFTTIGNLIEETTNKILNGEFGVKVLKDSSKTKKEIDKEWFSIYEALAFYNTNHEEDEEGEDDD